MAVVANRKEPFRVGTRAAHTVVGLAIFVLVAVSANLLLDFACSHACKVGCPSIAAFAAALLSLSARLSYPKELVRAGTATTLTGRAQAVGIFVALFPFGYLGVACASAKITRSESLASSRGAPVIAVALSTILNLL